MTAEVVNLQPRTPLPKPRRTREVQYDRRDWEQIEDHLWRASIELQRAVALLYATRRDK